MIIKKVETYEEAIECNKLLTKLINDEKKYNDNIKENYIIDNWYENIYDKNNNILYIAIENNSIIGYIYVKINTSNKSPEKYYEALISGLYVIEEYRKKGIATLLINKAKEWSKKMNAKYITLEVLSKNEDAINLYKDLDFKEFSLILKSNI